VGRNVAIPVTVLLRNAVLGASRRWPKLGKQTAGALEKAEAVKRGNHGGSSRQFGAYRRAFPIRFERENRNACLPS
jgi:hypothetical protein